MPKSRIPGALVNEAVVNEALVNNIAQRVVLGLLRAYRRAVSPLLPPACRYVPTCSEYAMEAVERYGAIRGSAMAVWRVLRCHPFTQGGLDPVVKSSCTH
ncbi:MAG TPA: membrane protein insertion efficiency factor YidD [Terriglobales bacterium]|nr:membrane protein insertion efficiency factor YidD [Terriglobales bacterium]